MYRDDMALDQLVRHNPLLPEQRLNAIVVAFLPDKWKSPKRSWIDTQ